MKKFNELTIDDKRWLLNETTGLTMDSYPNIEDYANEAIVSAFCDVDLKLYDACKFVDMYDSWSGFDKIIHTIFNVAGLDYELDDETILVKDDEGETVEKFYDVGNMWEWFENELGI